MKLHSSFMLVLIGIIALSIGAHANTEPSKSVKVEFLVYSGNPNPVFHITDPSVITEIQARIESAEFQSRQSSDAHSGLRNVSVGFLVTVDSDEILVLHHQIWSVTDTGELEESHDRSEVSLQQLLVEQGVAAGIFQ